MPLSLTISTQSIVFQTSSFNFCHFLSFKSSNIFHLQYTWILFLTCTFEFLTFLILCLLFIYIQRIFTYRKTFPVVCSCMNFDKCIKSCIHSYTSLQNNLVTGNFYLYFFFFFSESVLLEVCHFY